MARKHKDVEYAVQDGSGQERIFKTFDEAAAKAIEIAGIDVDAAAEDAVDTDGEAHFLARYDSNDYHTKSGLVYWRDN